MCKIEKNRINDLIDKKLYQELDIYIDKYLELTKDFTRDEYFKKNNKEMMCIFNEKYGTDFTEYEISTIRCNVSIGNLYTKKGYKFKE